MQLEIESNTGYDKQAGRQAVKVAVSYHTQGSAKRGAKQANHCVFVCVPAHLIADQEKTGVEAWLDRISCHFPGPNTFTGLVCFILIRT